MGKDDLYGRAYLFCIHCGTLLTFDNPDYAECLRCGFKLPAAEYAGKEIQYCVSSEDLRRGIMSEPFIRDPAHTPYFFSKEDIKGNLTKETCPKCQNPELEYYTKQLRSADEGETTFYTCPKCGHKFNS